VSRLRLLRISAARLLLLVSSGLLGLGDRLLYQVGLVPYLENMLYGINTLNKTIKTTAKAANSGDAVDKLF